MTPAGKLLARITPSPWTAYRMTHADTGEPLTPEEVGEYVVNSIHKSAELSGTTDFLFVGTGTAKDGVDICHIGNGPNGPNGASTICGRCVVDSSTIKNLHPVTRTIFSVLLWVAA